MSLDAQIGGLRERLAEQDLLARVVTAEEAHDELSRGNKVAKVVAVFKALDLDKNGTVSLKELQAGMMMQRLHLSDEEATRFMCMIDQNTDGNVQISEFMVRIQYCLGCQLTWA